MSIPTYYGDEICRVNGMKYAKDVILSSIKAWAQDLSILYDRRYDVTAPNSSQYVYKDESSTTHTLALNRIPPGCKVLDLGSASGYLSQRLAAKRVSVTAVDIVKPVIDSPDFEFVEHDLNDSAFPFDISKFQYVLLLDVIEHLHSPEGFVDKLRKNASQYTGLRQLRGAAPMARGRTRGLEGERGL